MVDRVIADPSLGLLSPYEAVPRVLILVSYSAKHNTYQCHIHTLNIVITIKYITSLASITVKGIRQQNEMVKTTYVPNTIRYEFMKSIFHIKGSDLGRELKITNGTVGE
jgi:hypothetical protein